MLGVEDDGIGGARHRGDEQPRRPERAGVGQAVARADAQHQRLAADHHRLALVVEAGAEQLQLVGARVVARALRRGVVGEAARRRADRLEGERDRRMQPRQPGADDDRDGDQRGESAERARRRDDLAHGEGAERRLDRVERVGEDEFDLGPGRARFLAQPLERRRLGGLERAAVDRGRRQRHHHLAAFERLAVLDDVVADQRQLAAQAADRADRDGRRAGRVGQHDLAGGEDDAGVAAERLADRRQRQAETGRARVLVRQAADLQFGNAQIPAD